MMKTIMTRILFGKKLLHKLDEIDHLDRFSTRTHATHLRTIAKARRTADNLNKALEANHITIQILNATGNKNNVRSRNQSKS